MIIAAANVDELLSIFTNLKQSVPTAALQNAMNVAERILSPQDWEKLESQIKTK